MGESFGNRLRSERLNRHLTHTDLAGGPLQRRDVSLLESGRREPRPGSIRLLAQRLAPAKSTDSPSAGVAAGSLVLALEAMQAWDERDYERCRDAALLAAAAAQAEEQPEAEWDLSHLAVLCLRSSAQFAQCVREAALLAHHPLSRQSPVRRARSQVLLASALQGTGDLLEAVEHARVGFGLAQGRQLGAAVLLEACGTLVATLTESGSLDEAWGYCQAFLLPLIDALGETSEAAKGLWTVGNVAFWRGDSPTGLRYHGRASKLLAPGSDVALWASFNNASAALRLQAGLHDAGVLACLEHAEAGQSVVGAAETDRLQLMHNRGRWLEANGHHRAGVTLLSEVYRRRSGLALHEAAEVALDLGVGLASLDEHAAARTYLLESQRYFDTAGAPARAAVAARLAASMQGT